MAALYVPFSASDLPSLSVKVCRGSNPLFPNRYSSSIKEVFVKILQRDYRSRPSADELLALPFIASCVCQLTQPADRSRPPIQPGSASPRHSSETPLVRARSQSPDVRLKTPPPKSTALASPRLYSPRVRSLSPARNVTNTSQISPVKRLINDCSVRKSQDHSRPGRSLNSSRENRDPKSATPRPDPRTQRCTKPKAVSPTRSFHQRKASESPLGLRNQAQLSSVSPRIRGINNGIYPSSPLRQRLNS